MRGRGAATRRRAAADQSSARARARERARRRRTQPTTRTLFALVLAGIALKALLLLLANRQVGYAVAHVATSLRLQLIQALLATRWSYYVHKPIGAIANSVAMEAQAAADAYLHGTTVLALLVQCVVFASISCLVSWQATLGGARRGVGDHDRLEPPGAARRGSRAGGRPTDPRAARAPHRHAAGREAAQGDGARAVDRAGARRRNASAQSGRSSARS